MVGAMTQSRAQSPQDTDTVTDSANTPLTDDVDQAPSGLDDMLSEILSVEDPPQKKKERKKERKRKHLPRTTRKCSGQVLTNFGTRWMPLFISIWV